MMPLRYMPSVDAEELMSELPDPLPMHIPSPSLLSTRLALAFDIRVKFVLFARMETPPTLLTLTRSIVPLEDDTKTMPLLKEYTLQFLTVVLNCAE